MKTKMTFALMAILTSSAFAAFQAPLPEFKNEKQLAEWRAEMAAKDTPQTTTENTAFYTGKPYLESTNSYAFKYRSYNPELARWTSEDPSGFPDGANGSVYAPNPNSELDSQGLFKITITGTKYRVGKESQQREFQWGYPPTYSWESSGSSWGNWQADSNSFNLPANFKWVSEERATGAETTSSGDWELDPQSITRRHRTMTQEQGWARDAEEVE